jgi:hypothetical protein
MSSREVRRTPIKRGEQRIVEWWKFSTEKQSTSDGRKEANDSLLRNERERVCQL